MAVSFEILKQQKIFRALILTIIQETMERYLVPKLTERDHLLQIEHFLLKWKDILPHQK